VKGTPLPEPNQEKTLGELHGEVKMLRARVAELLDEKKEQQFAEEGQRREHDLRERLRRETGDLKDALRRQRVLSSAIEAVREGVVITDAQLEGDGPRLLYVNDYFCELSGYTAQELSEQPFRFLLAEGKNDAVWRQLEVTLRFGEPFRAELVNLRRDGSEYVVSNHMSPVRNNEGVLTHLIFIQADITLEKAAELALRQSEERYRLLIEKMNEGFVATDEENRVDLVNAKFVEMLGFSREEMRGHSLGNFVDQENRRKLEAQEARRRAGVAEPYELGWEAQGGRKVDTIISPTSLHDSQGCFVGSFAVITDITERKKMEEERRRLEGRIQQAQRMESLAMLAGGVAHDFNNLLVGMLGHAGLALMDLPAHSSTRPLIHQIETAALRASELTKEMLAYSGKGKFLVEAIDLSVLVEEMAHLLKVSINKNAQLKFHFAKDLPTIEGDSTQIRQIVMNLITNASEAMDERSGSIIIKTGEMHADRSYLRSTYMDDGLEERDYIYLEVSDSGVGMDVATCGKIFDPFFTTKFTGRGLGLAAVLGIVRGHQGAIKVSSEVDHGTSFKVLFPATGERSARPPAEPKNNQFSFRGSGLILVVDDEEMVRGVAQLSLETVGYEVVTAEDGEAALEIFRREGARIDAVLLDMTMPKMGGEEAFLEIRRLRPETRVILSSGFNEEESVDRFLGKGPDGFLQKPFQPQELIRAVRQLLAQ
jgi:PAS domain S-box-containing protein